MKGTVPGRMMLEKIFTLEAEKLRATRMKRASLVLTPDWVLMRIGMTAPRKTSEPERNRQRKCRAVAQDEFGCADLNVVPEVAIVAQLPACLRDLRGGGDEQRIDEAAAPERFPKQQHGDERAAADHQALVLEVEACEARASALAMRGQFGICRNGHEQPDAATAL